MINIRLMVACTLFFFSFLALAGNTNFNGEWGSSTGLAYNTSGWRAKCKPLTLEVDQNSKRIEIGLSKISCGDLTADPYSIVFQIRESLVYLNGMRVGSFKGSGFQARFPASSRAIVTIVFTKMGPKKMRYQEQISNGNSATVLDAQFVLQD